MASHFLYIRLITWKPIKAQWLLSPVTATALLQQSFKRPSCPKRLFHKPSSQFPTVISKKTMNEIHNIIFVTIIPRRSYKPRLLTYLLGTGSDKTCVHRLHRSVSVLILSLLRHDFHINERLHRGEDLVKNRELTKIKN